MSGSFADQMLKATFGFARLALSNAILINGAAATALMAFLATRSVGGIPVGFYNAVLRFAVGAGLGGAASMLAYIGQRLDWERAARPPGNHRATVAVISVAMLAGASAYLLFFSGCFAAAGALNVPAGGHVVESVRTHEAPSISTEVSEIGQFWQGRLVEWLTAVGTIGAACTALWLGLRQDRVRVLATADLWRQGDPAMPHKDPDILVLSVSNGGSSRVTTAAVYWLIGRHKPTVVAAPISGSNPWQLKISPGGGADGGMLLSDLARTVVPALRDHGGPARLYIRLVSGKKVKCRLSRQVEDWLKAAAV
jgi:hypothetical protein